MGGVPDSVYVLGDFCLQRGLGLTVVQVVVGASVYLTVSTSLFLPRVKSNIW